MGGWVGVGKAPNPRGLRPPAPSRGHSGEGGRGCQRWDGGGMRRRTAGPGVGRPAVSSPPKGPFSFWLRVTTQKRSQNRKGFGFFNPSPGSE